MKTADEIERELTEALGLKYEGPGVRPLLRKLAEREAALWAQLEALVPQREPVHVPTDLHAKLDEIARRVPGHQRRRSSEQSPETPIWNSLELSWDESDAQLRARIRGEPPVVPSAEEIAREMAAHRNWQTQVTCAAPQIYSAHAGTFTAWPPNLQADHVSISPRGLEVGWRSQYQQAPQPEHGPCEDPDCKRCWPPGSNESRPGKR